MAKIENLKDDFYHVKGILFKRKNNKQIGSRLRNGYLIFTFKNLTYYVHRVVWCLENNTEIPENSCIDHIDTIKDNNDPKNLRPATHSQNMMNSKVYKNSSLKEKGISFDQGYRVRLSSNGKRYHIGRFDTLEEAILKRDLALTKLHGEFARG